jgi:hypothetical protein
VGVCCRTTRGLWAGIPNSGIRAILERLWENDSELDIPNNLIDTAEGYLLYHNKVYGTKFCICPRGFPDNTALIADSIRYGCVPGNNIVFPCMGFFYATVSYKLVLNSF